MQEICVLELTHSVGLSEGELNTGMADSLRSIKLVIHT